MQVRIFKPAKTAMQSGTGNTHEWVLEPEPSRKGIDPLMGWTSSRNTMQQVRLFFPTLEEAKAHAEKNGWSGPRPTPTISPTTASVAGRTDPRDRGRTIACETKVPHFVRDDIVCLIGALRKSQQHCHPERSEGPFSSANKRTATPFGRYAIALASGAL